jgi:tetratricopeptide (TPR) repeat protein
LRFCEDARQLLPLANELVTAAEQARQSEPLLFGHFVRCWGLLEIGRLHEWHAAAAEHGRLSACLRHPTHTYWSTMMSAVPMVLGADLESAYERARSGYQLGEEIGDPLAIPLFGCALLSIYRAEDGRAEALRWLPDLRAIAVKTLELAPAYVPWRVIMMNIDHALGRVDIATREFRRFVEPGYEAINRDRNYFAVLSELGRMAALLGDREHIEKLYALLLPYAGMHLVPMCGYLGPAHYSLALLRRALADDEGASDHFGLALADAERVEARSWIEKIRLEMSGEDARPRSTPTVLPE